MAGWIKIAEGVIVLPADGVLITEKAFDLPSADLDLLIKKGGEVYLDPILREAPALPPKSPPIPLGLTVIWSSGRPRAPASCHLSRNGCLLFAQTWSRPESSTSTMQL